MQHLIIASLLIGTVLAGEEDRLRDRQAKPNAKGLGQSMTAAQGDAILQRLNEEAKQVAAGNTSWWTPGPTFDGLDISAQGDTYGTYTINDAPPHPRFRWSPPGAVYPGPASMPRPPYAANRPSNNFVWRMGGINTIRKFWPGCYWWHVVPDSHIPTLRTADGNQWMIIWSEATNFRSVINSTVPWWDQTANHRMNPSWIGGWNIVYPTPIFGGDTANNRGKWLMAVQRHPVRGGRNLVGFYHFQDHQWGNGVITGPADWAWKMIGVAWSNDDGASWTDGGAVLTGMRAKPNAPAWGYVLVLDVTNPCKWCG